MMQFVSRTHVAVCESQAGKSVPDEFCLGGLGVTGTQCSDQILTNADLLVSWGCRLGDFVTSSNSGIPNHCILVNVNITPSDATKFGGHSVLGDVLTVLQILDSCTKGWTVPETYAQ
jgi:3D-(3,5/4)-trihydroxycyclohexane-1,2-dione acylhydrolase (decyclizing)